MGDVAELGSVTFTFKAKATGSGAFSISGVVLSTNATISNGSTSITVEAAKSNNNSNKKPTTNNKPTTNKNENKDEEQKEPEIVLKTELEALMLEIQGLVQTDYTADSWNTLQGVIANAQNATTQADYDAVKEGLKLDGLVPVEFSKDELNKVLRELIREGRKRLHRRDLENFNGCNRNSRQ